MSNLEGTISGMEPLDQVSGDEWLEVVYQGGNFRIRTALLFGQQGKSAYQVAVDNGYVGTQVQWLTTLIGARGMSAYESAVDNGFVGDLPSWLASLKGADGQDGNDGAAGKSAYELAQQDGFVGDLQAWFASLHGADGQDGVDGLSAYEIAKLANPELADEAAFLASLKGADGQDGVSVRSVQIDVNGNLIVELSDDTLTDLGRVVGTAGADGQDGQDGAAGLSAFEIARQLDPAITTEEEFIASLKGEKGDAGGGSAAGLIDFNLVGDVAELPTVPLADQMVVISEAENSSSDPYTILVDQGGLSTILPGQSFRIHNNTSRVAVFEDTAVYGTYFANGDTAGTLPSYGSVTITNITTAADEHSWFLIEHYEVPADGTRVIGVTIVGDLAEAQDIKAGDLFLVDGDGILTTTYNFSLGNAVLTAGESIRIYNGTSRPMAVAGDDVWAFSFAHPAEWPLVKPLGHALLTRIDDGVDPRLLVVGDLQDDVPPTFLTAVHTDMEPMQVVHVSRRNTVYGTTMSRTIPADVMIDDLMIVVTASGGNNDLGVPAGWTLAAEAIDQPNQGTACRVYSRHVQFGDAGQTITWSSSLGENDMAMQLIIFRGVKRPEILTSAVTDSATGITDSLPIANVESSDYQQIALAANVSDYYSGRFLAPEGWVQVSPIVESESDGFSNSFLAVAYKRLALGETTGNAVFNNPDDDEVDAFTSAVTLLIGQI